MTRTFGRATATALIGISIALSGALSAGAAVTPAIQLSPANQAPACIQPAKLMTFVKRRNKALPDRFADIAEQYKRHGVDLGVRWDYAFFQMIVETNYLKYKTGSGRWGDVRPKQNNFAGLGATGGGEPGESFKTVSKGVRAHLQHILMYSGERIEKPVAKRTALVQDWLLPWSRAFGRPVTFTDLTKKWSPTDRGYSNDIEQVAISYRRRFCKNNTQTVAAKSGTIKPASTRIAGLGAGANDVGDTSSTGRAELLAPKSAPVGRACKVWTARFENGARGLLIRSKRQKVIHYTALEVQSGQETAQAQAYIARYAPGGAPIGEFSNHNGALNKAFELCPTG